MIKVGEIMPVVVIASPKGGVGKSTCAVLLMTQAAQMGIEVTALDCDPNHSLSIWAEAGLPAGITMRSGVGASDVVRTIRAAEGNGKLVVVDLEGVASQLVSRAISQADLVLVPMQATHLDAMVGGRALALVAEEEETLGRRIRSAVVLTKTSTVRSMIHRELEQQLGELSVDLVQPPLLARSAFAELFSFGGNLEGLRKIRTAGNVQAAIDNAQAYTEAVLGRLN